MVWIAETGSGPSKTQSAWDSNWVSKYGGVDDPHRRNGLEPTDFRPRKYAFQKQALLRRNHLPQKNNDYSLTKRILSVPKCIVLKEYNFRGRSLHPAYPFFDKRHGPAYGSFYLPFHYVRTGCYWVEDEHLGPGSYKVYLDEYAPASQPAEIAAT